MIDEKVKKAILILDGHVNCQYIKDQIAQDYKDMIICTDGAYSHIKKIPDLLERLAVVIGDFDSISIDAVTEEYITIIQNSDQNSTDFDKALGYLQQLNISDVDVYGASGLGSDHFLGNLSSALLFKSTMTLTFRDQYGVFFFIDSECRLQGLKGRTLSVIPFFRADNVSYKGLKYPLNNETLTFGKRIGTRNEAISDEVIIRYDGGNLLVYIENQDYIKEY